MLVEATPEAFEISAELMIAADDRGVAAAGAERYSDEQLRLFLEFTRTGREIQERHAQWLRERLG